MAVSRPLLGPRRSVWLAIIGVVFYTRLVGAGALVVRAAIMSSLALNPRLALISVGAGNAEGNPAPTVLARLVGRDVLRTDQHGAIMLETDGTQMWVAVSR